MGAWFLGTFLFSIPAYFFYDPLLTHADYVVGAGEDSRVGVGALLEVLLAVSGIATAVVIFPIVKRVNESIALGYVAARTVESIIILVGVAEPDVGRGAAAGSRGSRRRQRCLSRSPGVCSRCMTRPPFSVHSSAPGSGTESCWAT